jgi:hypothetical protein
MLYHLQRPLTVIQIGSFFMKLLQHHRNDVQSGIGHLAFCSEPSTYMKKWHGAQGLMPLLKLSQASIKLCTLLDFYIDSFISFQFQHLFPLDLHKVEIIITLYIENDLNFMFLCHHNFLMRSVDMLDLDNRCRLVHNLHRDHTLQNHQNHNLVRNRNRNRRT